MLLALYALLNDAVFVMIINEGVCVALWSTLYSSTQAILVSCPSCCPSALLAPSLFLPHALLYLLWVHLAGFTLPKSVTHLCTPWNIVCITKCININTFVWLDAKNTYCKQLVDIYHASQINSIRISHFTFFRHHVRAFHKQPGTVNLAFWGCSTSLNMGTICIRTNNILTLTSYHSKV